MNSPTMPTVVMVPGLRGHVAEHWQTLLQKELPKSACVPPLEHDTLSCAARVAALDATLAKIDGPVILVAHSAGVMITVHWAQHRRREIHGAVLAAPADLETPLPAGYPTLEALAQNGWLPIPRGTLPFPSIVAASRNDPLARFERVSGMAKDWGSRLVDLGDVGHLNPASGFGEWKMAHRLIQELV
ncbi:MULTISPECIES: alpha/beta hydrolase [unclassified Caballeronia]|uniref:RBBP9/YdeN family alpha/beta hydrolase n=1 Tax=unclassified Caballeronia TaxID=2646786 RepID=UPI002029A233|nr:MULTISPECIES: alpha/beta fold hydrolase [unclassified Caballeronia]